VSARWLRVGVPFVVRPTGFADRGPLASLGASRKAFLNNNSVSADSIDTQEWAPVGKLAGCKSSSSSSSLCAQIVGPRDWVEWDEKWGMKSEINGLEKAARPRRHGICVLMI